MSRSIETINARETPIQSVTVFIDRAEITRKLNVSLKSGVNEVRFENVAGSVEPNSIRIDGVGDAVIHGVKYESKPVNFDDIDLPKVKELRNKLKEVEAEAQKERDLQSIYNARIEALNNAVKTIGQSSTKGDSSNIVSFDGGAEATLDNFFDYHERKSLELKAKTRVVDKRIRELDLEISRLNDELNQYRWNLDSKNIISIEMENHGGDTEATLDISYQVYGARWSPSYDIRVKSEGVNHEMNITYFGSIQQQTGEDWNDVDLHLSTAQPGLGGDLPKLGTTVVQFKPPPPPPQQIYQNYGRQYVEMAACDVQSARLERCAPKMAHMAASATENTLSTTFSIPNKKSIPSDPAEHKITITVATLTAYLNYHCVPKKDTNVFLMATVINDTDYPILAGPASVYVNNSMSAMINLRATSAGEKLECPLGVDKTVKVIYKPTHKFQTKVGLINKNASSGNEQRIVVKNTKRAESILITLHEPVPKSTDEKIKVTLLSPDISKKAAKETEIEDNRIVHLPSVGAELDDLNNLLWTESVEAGNEKTFIIKWSVDYPPTETLEYVEESQQE